MADTLTSKTCTPCKGGIPPFDAQEAERFHRQVPQWEVRDAAKRIERKFKPGAIRKLKEQSQHDMYIGGSELAGTAIEAGLVDECHVFVYPVITGGGKPAFRAGLRLNFELLDTHRFNTGVVYLRYRIVSA